MLRRNVSRQFMANEPVITCDSIILIKEWDGTLAIVKILRIEPEDNRVEIVYADGQPMIMAWDALVSIAISMTTMVKEIIGRFEIGSNPLFWRPKYGMVPMTRLFVD